MKTTITKYDFINAIEKSRRENFSRAGLCALFEYFEEFEDSTGEEIELDPIGICCEFNEYETLEEIQEAYEDCESIEWLQDNTTVIEFDGGIIIASF